MPILQAWKLDGMTLKDSDDHEFSEDSDGHGCSLVFGLLWILSGSVYLFFFIEQTTCLALLGASLAKRPPPAPTQAAAG